MQTFLKVPKKKIMENNSLDKVSNWLESERKNDNCYYRFYTIKFANSNATRKDLRSTNFVTQNLDDCITKLNNDMIIHGQTAEKFFLLNHIGDKKDAHPISIVFENPYYDSSVHKSSGIHGIHSMNNNNNDMILNLMKDNHNSNSQMREEIMNLRHEHELEKMDTRIAELEDGHKNSVERIGEFFQTDVGQKIVSSVTQLLSQKMAIPQKQNEVQKPIKTSINEPVQKTIENPEHKQDKEISSLNESLVKLDQVFNGDGLNALNELAQFCVDNPDMAKQIRKKPISNE
jgi:hypothetical protein|tara:strand:+ start:7196 stop:8059 length:864 start_codon:yes stop_codon:yes gene_type:complete